MVGRLLITYKLITDNVRLGWGLGWMLDRLVVLKKCIFGIMKFPLFVSYKFVQSPTQFGAGRSEKVIKKEIETPNLVQRCIFVCWTTFYFYLYLKKCHLHSQILHFLLQLVEKCCILPPLLNRVLWMLLCIGQNISEASSHLQLLPDLLERDDGFPQLNCSSLLSFEPQKKASYPVACLQFTAWD